MLTPGDTETVPQDLGAYASRTTLIVGNAARKAAIDAKEQLLKLIAEKFECNAEDLEMKNKKIWVKRSPTISISFADALTYAQYEKSTAILGRVYYDTPTSMPDLHEAKGNTPAAYSFGAAVAEMLKRGKRSFLR